MVLGRVVAESWVLIKKRWMLLDLRAAHKEGEFLSLGYPADTPGSKRGSRQDPGGSVKAKAAAAVAAAEAAAAAAAAWHWFRKNAKCDLT